jgi:GT2 family glycosyltransferase
VIVASIIVATAKPSSDVTRECLAAVEKYTSLPYELFVVRDDPAHFGFSRENNRIMRIADGKYYVLLNDDCFVHEGWLEKMIEMAESDDRIGLVGAKLSGMDGKIQYGADKTGPNGETDNIAFALVLIKRSVTEKIGLMNESYRFGSEDSEYCIKARQAGFKLAISEATATHLRNSSVDFRSLILKSRGGFYIGRSRGQSLTALMPIIGYDVTFPLRRTIRSKAPGVFGALRRYGFRARRAVVGW